MKSERDLFLDTIKEIVETNNWDGNKDKKIKYLQSQLDQQKAMWNELEKYIIDSSINYNISQETKDWFARIIVKMQELEQGEKDGNNK